MVDEEVGRLRVWCHRNQGKSSDGEDWSAQREPRDVKTEIGAADLGTRTSVALVKTLDGMIGTGATRVNWGVNEEIEKC